MNGRKNKFGSSAVWGIARPTLTGLLLSCAVTAGLIAVFSLVFVLLETIFDSAIVPLALISAALGCFAGAFLCASMVREKGVLFGLAIGFLMFLGIWLLGLLCSHEIFGSETAVKLLLLALSGAVGGYLGGNCRTKRRK